MLRPYRLDAASRTLPNPRHRLSRTGTACRAPLPLSYPAAPRFVLFLFFLFLRPRPYFLSVPRLAITIVSLRSTATSLYAGTSIVNVILRICGYRRITNRQIFVPKTS